MKPTTARKPTAVLTKPRFGGTLPRAGTARKPTGKADRDRMIKAARKLDHAARQGEAAGLGGAARATNPFNWEVDAALHASWNDGWLKGNLAMHVAKAGKGKKLVAKTNGAATKKGKADTWLKPNYNAASPASAGPFKTIAQAAAHAQARGWQVTITGIGEGGDKRYILVAKGSSVKPAESAPKTAKEAVQKAVNKAIANGAPVVTEKRAPVKAPATPAPKARKGGRRIAKPVTLPVVGKALPVSKAKSAPTPAPKNGNGKKAALLDRFGGMTEKDIVLAMAKGRQTTLLEKRADNEALDKALRTVGWTFRALWNRETGFLYQYAVNGVQVFVAEISHGTPVYEYEARWLIDGEKIGKATGKNRYIIVFEEQVAAELLAREVERRERAAKKA